MLVCVLACAPVRTCVYVRDNVLVCALCVCVCARGGGGGGGIKDFTCSTE